MYLELDHISGDMEFSLYGREGDTLAEVVSQFKYPERTLDQPYDNCPDIRQIIRRERKVWYYMGNILVWEGEDNQVLKMFNRAVVQVVLIFGSKLWATLEAMMRTVEVTHVGLLSQITGKRARRTIESM